MKNLFSIAKMMQSSLKKKESQHTLPMKGTDLYDEITKVGSKLKAKELRKK